MADFHLERAAGGIVAGIDEAGRGPLAGPVIAAAVILDPRTLAPSLAETITDSKLLSPKRREFLMDAFARSAVIGVGSASVAEIDRINILQATLLAMRRAVARLGVTPDCALVDGNRAPGLEISTQTIIRGDRLSLSIAAASIVAKVTRDRLMARLARRFPGFGWERNSGYGTAEHRAALARIGPTRHHRMSFAPVKAAMPAKSREEIAS